MTSCKKDNTSHVYGQEQVCVGGRGRGVLITKVKINMLCLIASGNRLKANLKGYMSQLCMLALCFLSKIWKTSAHNIWTPEDDSRKPLQTPPHSGRRKSLLQSKDVLGGPGASHQPRRKPHTLRREGKY